jgi:uncharacterized protein
VGLFDSVERRFDAWQNVLTGLGMVERDRLQSTFHYTSGPLPDQELSSLYNEDDLARRIVRTWPETAWREGFDLDTDDGEDEKALRKTFDARRGSEILCEADCLGLAYGGAAIVVYAQDGRGPELPLDESNIETISSLRVADRRELIPYSVNTDPESDHFGETEIYTYQPAVRFGFLSQKIHRSRLILFGGSPVDAEVRARLSGWDYSILQLAYRSLRNSDQADHSMAHLLTDVSQAVMRVAGLMKAISGGFENKVIARVQFLNMTRSLLKTIILDADEAEDYKREATPLTGVADVADRIALRLCAASGIPYSLLFGRSANALNASGDGDLKIFYDRVRDRQQKTIEPRTRRLLYLLCCAKDGPTQGRRIDMSITWKLLMQPSPKEDAEIEKLIVEADEIRINSGVVTQDEIALSRYSDNGFSRLTKIDRAAREALIKQEQNATLLAQAAKTAKDLYAYDYDYRIATVNEIRAQKGLPAIPGGDVFPVSQAVQDNEKSSSPEAPPVNEDPAKGAPILAANSKADRRHDSRKALYGFRKKSPR